MKKYRKILIALLVVTIAYVMFDFAYNVSGIYHSIFRCIGGMLILFTGVFIRDGYEWDAEKKEPIQFKQGDVLYAPKYNIWVIWDEHNDTAINFIDFKLFIGHHFDSSITVEDVHVASEQQRSQLIQMLREKTQMYIGRNSIVDEIKSALKAIEK